MRIVEYVVVTLIGLALAYVVATAAAAAIGSAMNQASATIELAQHHQN